MANDVEQLKQFVLDNYERGGHWVYETHDDEDYQRELRAVGGSLPGAKKGLKQYWEMMNEQETNAAWDGPESLSPNYEW